MRFINTFNIIRLQNNIFQDFSANFLTSMKLSAFVYQPLRTTKMTGDKIFRWPKLGNLD